MEENGELKNDAKRNRGEGESPLVESGSAMGASLSDTAATLFDDFWRSAAHSGLDAPRQGIAQAVNYFAGKQVMSEDALLDGPAPAEFLTGRWLTQQVGGAVGMLPLFAATHGVLGLGLKSAVRAETAETVSLLGLKLSSRTLSTAHLAASGATYETLFHAGDSNNNFWTERGTNALTGGITFGGMGYAYGKLGRLSEAGRGAVSGAFGGALQAESRSLISKGELADVDEVSHSLITYGIVGGALGAAGQARTDYGRVRPGRLSGKEARLMDSANVPDFTQAPAHHMRVEIRAPEPAAVEARLQGERSAIESLPVETRQRLDEARHNHVQGTRSLADGHRPEAVKQLETALATRMEILGQRHSELPGNLRDLSDAYWQSGKESYPKAEEALKRSLEIETDLYGADSVQTAGTHQLLSGVQKGQGKYGQAAVSLSEALRIYDALSTTGRLSQADMFQLATRRRAWQESLADLYKADGKTDLHDEVMRTLEPPEPPPGYMPPL